MNSSWIVHISSAYDETTLNAGVLLHRRGLEGNELI